MNHPSLVGAVANYPNVRSWHDRVQLALAIADADLLKALLVDCIPSITQTHRIGGIHSTIGVPLSADLVAHGLINFEEIGCVLADSPEQLERGVAEYSRQNGNQRGYLDLIRCETDMRTLGQTMSLSQAISTLNHVGFGTHQVEEILNLPYDGWHKSWWYQADQTGAFTIPFLRLLRTRRFPDGTFMLQYKDFFAQEQPTCFRSLNQQILIEILPESYQFQAILAKINLARQQLDIAQVLLICNQISDLEAQGFIHQGISLYLSQDPDASMQSNCSVCGTQGCPMQGRIDSPVLLCQQFSAPSSPS